MLEVRGISRSFGNHLIVNDISFSVASGTILALLGPNGCGKSTTLKVLSGALPPTAGEYWIDGHAGRSDPARRATGYVPDTRGIFLGSRAESTSISPLACTEPVGLPTRPRTSSRCSASWK